MFPVRLFLFIFLCVFTQDFWFVGIRSFTYDILSVERSIRNGWPSKLLYILMAVMVAASYPRFVHTYDCMLFRKISLPNLLHNMDFLVLSLNLPSNFFLLRKLFVCSSTLDKLAG